jgi:hypothetical protein
MLLKCACVSDKPVCLYTTKRVGDLGGDKRTIEIGLKEVGRESLDWFFSGSRDGLVTICSMHGSVSSGEVGNCFIS